MRRFFVVLLMAGACFAQQAEEDFAVQGEHPRLLLNAHRLKLLRRERERQSIRWQQFETLMAGKARMPEPGFALALYSLIAEKPEACAAAGREPGQDPRQAALVYDWCLTSLDASTAKALQAKLRQALAAPAPRDIPGARDRVFAAIALGDEAAEPGERALRAAVAQWRTQLLAALKRGANPIPRSAVYAAAELLHAVRDQFGTDLREAAPGYFKDLAAAQMLSYYPATYPTPENDFRIPIYGESGEPDLRVAALSRAADLALVAYDTNSLECQYLQGWVIHDRFLMRGAFGIPYELLWANPYQPGLPFSRAPLVFHDPKTGRLFLRSTWEEDATWFALQDGQMQLFRDGRPGIVKGDFPPLRIGDAMVIPGHSPMKFSRETAAAYLAGLKPNARYDVETDGEEMREEQTDAAGTLVLRFGPESEPGVRIKEAGSLPEAR